MSDTEALMVRARRELDRQIANDLHDESHADALRQILDLHAPEPESGFCSHCWTVEGDMALDLPVRWPCPSARIVLSALGLEAQ